MWSSSPFLLMIRYIYIFIKIRRKYDPAMNSYAKVCQEVEGEKLRDV